MELNQIIFLAHLINALKGQCWLKDKWYSKILGATGMVDELGKPNTPSRSRWAGR